MSIRQLFTVILLLALFGFSLRVPADPDLWWHLRLGQYILEEGIPHEDPDFAFTTEGRPWITHEWLTDILMYVVYDRAGGLYGLSILFAALTTLTFGLLYFASDGRPYLAGLATFWGICASLPFINVRPQIFNILFGALIIFIVEGVRRRGWSHRLFWLFPVLIALWVNMHGGYLLGLVVMGVYVVGDGAQTLLRGADDSRDERLAWAAVMTLVGAGLVSVFAALLNPNGIDMWFYAFETLSSGAMREAIEEWKSPNFHLWYMWFFGSMLLSTWGIMIYSRRPVLWTDLLFVAGTSFAGLQSMRNIPLFAMAVIPVLSRHLVGLFSEATAARLMQADDLQPASPASRIINVVLALFVIIGIGVFGTVTLSETEMRTAANFPVDAVAYIKAEGLDEGRIFNDYDWGGYLIWHQIPTFIDGRADLFGDEFLFQYLDTINRRSNWQEPFDQYDIDTILTSRWGDMAVVIDLVPEWELVYEDDVARIYRRSPLRGSDQ